MMRTKIKSNIIFLLFCVHHALCGYNIRKRDIQASNGIGSIMLYTYKERIRDGVIGYVYVYVCVHASVCICLGVRVILGRQRRYYDTFSACDELNT